MSAAASRDVVDLPPESLVVLTHDTELLTTLRAVATEHEISTVGAEADLATQLLENHAGVAVLDTSAVTSPIGQLAERLKAQFPDLVLVVAGSVHDQAALGGQIQRGTVYRFLHKPVSEQRVRLFVNAAWRRHDVEHQEIIEATASNLRAPMWAPPRPTEKTIKNMKWAGIAAAAAVALVLVTWFVTRQTSGPSEAAADSATATQPAPGAVSPEAELESLLARADAALRAGALTAPPAENAVDLYRQAMRLKSDDPRPGIGIERVMDKLLTAAEKALLEDRTDEAARLTDIARGIEPDHVRVAFLTTQIGKERERLLLAQARSAAEKGRVDEAIRVLDRASVTGGSTQQFAEARNQIAQKKVEDQVTEYLRRATDRIRSNALVEPAQNNARFFIESARAIAPNSPEVRQAQRQLADRIVAQARSAVSAGNADDADKWIQAATDAGVSRDDVTALTRDLQRMRIATRAESMAKLSQSFNQRLAQGRLVDPPNDSAKFYLTQLAQAEATHPSTVLARQALGAKLLEEARNAIGRQDFAAARRWMGEARDIGIDASGTASIEREITAAQANAARNEVVTAKLLTRTRYSPPEYPETARARGAQGWVDIIFTVRTDGSVGDVTVAGAEPAGIFEQAAMASVRKWRYQPVVRDGKPIEQRAKVRISFAMEP
ncbi:MAG TPA: TonB family protein [Steroidobacteraceae bacterium]|nr:TonB family protein [Steroidobacteraceae bacterium]